MHTYKKSILSFVICNSLLNLGFFYNNSFFVCWWEMEVNICQFYFNIIFLQVPFRVSFVHASCVVEERQLLRACLILDKPQNGPWLICGDFNVILCASEKKVAGCFRLQNPLI